MFKLLSERGLVEQKREMVKKISSNRLVSGENVYLTRLQPFEVVANRFQNAICGDTRGKTRTWKKLFSELVEFFTFNDIPEMDSLRIENQTEINSDRSQTI